MSDVSAMERLQALGIVLPEASKPAARYTNYVLAGNLLFISGKGPASMPKGKLGIDYSTEEGYKYACLAGLEVLAVLTEALGSLNRVKQVVKIQGFVNAGPEFEEHHKVLDGCSDLMLDVFGDRGVHARSVLGASSLRDNLPVIIDSVFEVEPNQSAAI
ncbi:RidA family protein [Paenibacillus pinisoli]|uniref:RidA family protein n=1 Tax=Paenibacillus pinisoli TaxID=1276110 RepID=A0A3A6PDD0_9BACL|nr:RidA family protein [Paenibacillus pinisoli]RJX38070.1 RidA family protein [Paenibacillus pinisoli]